MSWQLIHADCIDAMRELGESSVDAIVTDPPYGLHFMGKTWDSFGGPTGSGRACNMAKHDRTSDEFAAMGTT